MSKAAAEYLVEALEKAGVKRVYGVVGDSLNGFTDAMRRRKINRLDPHAARRGRGFRGRSGGPSDR